MHSRVLIQASTWERRTSTLGLTPVCWVLIALGFSPVYCILVALELTPIHCEVGSQLLVASFFLLLTDTEPYRECSNWRGFSPFVCEDLCSSSIGGLVLSCSSCSKFWEHKFYDSCIKFPSIYFIATHIVSTFYSMYGSHLACSSTSTMADCRPLWVCSWVCSLTRVDVLATCWCVGAIFLGNMAMNIR